MAPVIEVTELAKRYGGIVALDGLDLEVEAGTVHAIVGENGAGKSTLMRILAGSEQPDGGHIRYRGAEVRFSSPDDARRSGIAMVHQELSVFPERSVASNLFVGAEPSRWGVVQKRRMEAEARPLLARLGSGIDVRTAVGRLSIGERQLVEIARALLQSSSLLILDEPNSALTAAETRRLFGVLADLKRNGVTIVYVSHLLEEVFEIADAITVVRDGKAVLTGMRENLSPKQVVEAMLGRQAASSPFPTRAPKATTRGRALVVDNLVVPGALEGVSLTAEPGTVTGMAGLEGSGIAALFAVLFGVQTPASGAVTMPDGKPSPRSPTEAARRGIAFVPGDRRRLGLMLGRSVAFNLAHVAVGSLAANTVLLRDSELQGMARTQVASLRIRAGSTRSVVGTLSGGNQQKVVVGKWLAALNRLTGTSGPKVILLDDPTRGVDIGAKEEIYVLVRELCSDGNVVLFASTELPEVPGLSDVIYAFYRGRIVGRLDPAHTDAADLLHTINMGELGSSPARSPASNARRT